MKDFDTRYKLLNMAQKQAVDTTEGPVMVVAGPGTGKTELLSMRVANILRVSDVLPQNILCLTYTESGAFAMRDRLVGLIGPDAHKVAIHTFHSFGSELINRNAEYFYHGAYFRPADELSSYEVLKKIFEKLPHDNPLASKMNDDYTYLRDTQAAISDLKKSGLTSDELINILDKNESFISWLEPKLQVALNDRLSKKSFPAVEKLIDSLSTYTEDPYELITYEPLHEIVRDTLAMALEDAVSDNSTKPLSAWKREWCEKNANGDLTLKDTKRSNRLRAVASIYYQYLIAMQERSLFDFDDMILRAVHALEIFPDLRLNLQEQYQYILVDEFQDTNDAQMRLLWNLSNNPSSEGSPNVMVVGDDDQAIYRFQGANISNILDFKDNYRDVEIITLRDNYRSAETILQLARITIVQANERLERTLESVDKTLTPHFTPEKPHISFESYADEPTEYAALASRIASQISTKPNETTAIIARNHRQLQAMIPFLHQKGIPMSYDRRDNVLEAAPVEFLELLARIVVMISEQRIEEANGLLPELLSHPAWGIDAQELWALSIDAYKQKEFWLETMLSKPGRFSDIAEWLIYSAHLSLYEPLEYTIDHLTGTLESQSADSSSSETDEVPAQTHEGFISPLRAHFFSHDMLENDPTRYMTYLDALTSIRKRIRDYRPEGKLLLRDFIECINKYRDMGLSIQSGNHTTSDQNPVELLTAHKSKGLEFDNVHIVGLTDSVWGESARTRHKLIGYPHNLPIGISGGNSDEYIRLLFVALTRAKAGLYLSTHHVTANGKSVLPVGYLSHMDTVSSNSELPRLVLEETNWRASIQSVGTHTMEELLRDTLQKYKLSATHLCNFVDVAKGGPELFLLQNLLRFPQAMSPSAAFGSAVHTTLQRAHLHLTATGKKRPLEDVLADFETSLSEYQLANDQHDYFAKKGADVLNAFLAARYDSFTPSQKVEQSFASDGVVIDGVRLSGAIDLIDIDEEQKTITVTDYKTGKCTVSWQGKTEYEKIKLHHYRHQLIFYKLLIEHSRRYSGYTVTHGIIEYVEPDERGVVHRIELSYDDEEILQFQKLISAVWHRIQNLDFSTTESYEENLKGILAFEAELLES